ncbi:hypothetical protein CEXT_376021 [Caerostris extrusa]|uniref:Uncharacterized protein n=1 Tax=Caerostris extrusa TaxID=172846 RepID=A0AAV4TLC1_CAEEX|nr:hypothetical protein CEXT_376021 [Caerostris extrusa]
MLGCRRGSEETAFISSEYRRCTGRYKLDANDSSSSVNQAGPSHHLRAIKVLTEQPLEGKSAGLRFLGT